MSRTQISNNHFVLGPTRDESCYIFRIENTLTGRRSPAFLTFELFPNPTFERNLIICDDESLLSSGENRSQYEALNDALKADNRERFAKTKSIVNELVDGDRAFANVRIAVHKYGPVPVYVLGRGFEVQVHGRNVKAQIALFPSKNRRSKLSRPDKNIPYFLSSRTEFRKSMTVAPQVVFQRYFEDVAEDFRDIRRTLRQVDFYRRAKSAERRLAESIGAKLKVLVPKTPVANSLDPLQKHAWEYFSAHAETLYEAAVARSFALLLLNEVYACVGVLPRTDFYRGRINDYHALFSKLLGPDNATNIRKNSRILQFLQESYERYESKDLLRREFDIAQELLSLAKDAPAAWCAEFAKFSCFSLILQHFARPKAHVRLFVSHHHEVPAAVVTKDQISAYVAGEHRGVRALSVEKLPIGSPLRHILRSAIWLSHGTIALCPMDTQPISSNQDKDYKWIARESEHSLLLKKKLVFAMQDGAKQNAIITDLKDERIGYLVNGSKLPPNHERAKHVANHFSDNVFGSFDAKTLDRSVDYLDARLKGAVSSFITSLRDLSLETMLDGYVSQFDQENQRALIYSLAYLGPLGQKPRSWIVRKFAERWKKGNLANADRAFGSMWKNVRDRKLELGSRGVSLIDIRSNRYYCERLTLTLKLVNPSMKSSERKAWWTAWIGKWLGKWGDA